jgi:hypothetical protein
VSFVFFDRVRPNGDVVEINCAETADVFTEDPIHVLLKGCGGVAETLGHYDLFEHSEGCFEGCFMDIVFFH